MMGKKKNRSWFVIPTLMAVSLVGVMFGVPVIERVAPALSFLGEQTLGFDVTSVRQNMFSLAHDITNVPIIVDHSNIRHPYTLGLFNYISRGAIATAADLLKWANIPLTRRQAYSVPLCDTLAQLTEPVTVLADPYQYGIASWYGPGFHGQLAASGETYNMYDLTAAHRTLPLDSFVRVVGQRTGDAVTVRINDRGPYASGRIIDLSYHAKQLFGMDDLSAVYLERIDPSLLDSCK